MKTFSIIGCGAVGKTLGRLFHESGVLELRDVLTRSEATARAAAAFIGAGRPVTGFAQLEPADLYLITSSDDAIAPCVRGLCASGALGAQALVCHVSGALGSEVLHPATQLGALVASVHPVKSFADPAAAVGDFAGTWCGVEGDRRAADQMGELFGAIGARVFSIDPRFKAIYHAGSVLACNCLTALLEVAVKAYGKGGLDRETALQVMEPLVRGTVENVFRSGTVAALTGPIARGDAAVVGRQLHALDEWDPEVALVYRSLGAVALELSRRRGQAGKAGLERIEALLAGTGEDHA
ncbi:Rossmann-like and DUF2520 domain-containing protein [Geomonas ferrireducens]|uniref:Rossmann-like and DUF2520 domain-containing protein n=1 Tax=Geomonas ferrireducens TaxID=2570227 RepID=UPI0010A82CEB|nr:Rossmann-like and DUF2520 domain-containing protein [Geomonas ferrireducens]